MGNLLRDTTAVPQTSWPRPLSIAMLAACPFPTHQGTQVFIRHLAGALAAAGHDVHVIAYGHGEYESTLPFHLHRAPTLSLRLRSGPHLLKPAADLALAITALRVARAHGCDVIHAHNVEGLAVGAVLKSRAGIPLVYHAHNAMGPELPTYFERPAARAVASFFGDLLDRTLPHAADAVIAFDVNHKALHELYGVADNRIHVIPPGLQGAEIRGAAPAAVRALKEKLGPGPWILYAGNPDAYQNLSLLWQAFALVRQQRPDAKLLVATSYAPSVFAQSLASAPSSAGIVVHRYEGLDELRALFAVAQVGVCGRVLWTGVPIKVLNYLAAGLPVVACRNAARHLVAAHSGVVVEPEPAAFAAGILDILERPALGRKPHRHAFDRFRVEGQIGLYEQVYRSVLS